jgi:hypothetical protein
MGREYLPEEQRELEDDVGDVEDCCEPCVLARTEMQRLLHAGDLGIANVPSIEECQHIYMVISINRRGKGVPRYAHRTKNNGII